MILEVFQNNTFINLSYILASVLFIFGLKMLSSPDTAQRGNFVSSLGMLLAVVVTLLSKEIVSFQFILIGLIGGGAVGAIAAVRIKMTSMPELVALLNGFGGASSLLVASAELFALTTSNLVAMIAIGIATIIGGVTFSGSLIAFGKLSEIMPGKPYLFIGQKILTGLVILLLLLLLVQFCLGIFFAEILFGFDWINEQYALILLIALSLLLGILLAIPIGGADMPVIIALLNSYSGLAACAAGFVIGNNVLIVAGSLVGASGLILTNIMCKAMNRSLLNVLFGGFGATDSSSSSGEGKVQGDVKPINIADSYLILEAASSVLIVPGYGMAVSQAQHSVRELGELLQDNGCEVKYAIHPVAGRMPGHMNVLLAEANVSYDVLVEPQDVNPIMDTIDVCIVIGANDVVNPDAREDESSPIYGMPVIEVDRAKTVFVLKRSMASGFAGIENSLFFKQNTRMLFGDAKESVSGLVSEFKS
jgi:NAD(P) transhydrogenase subunit beta